jgi:hypothetical protein
VDKFYLEAKIEIQKETAERKKAVAAVIDLPKMEEKQPDLLYFTAIFVSTGTNLNGAHFLPIELVKAEDTIVSKALDVEHKEAEIIGHIYDRAYIDKDGNKLDLEELAGTEEASLNEDYKDMHVVIAGVIYKNRFPNLAQEMSKGEWKVSMECYFGNYDVKVGDMIMTRREAELMGLANDDNMFGKLAKVIKNKIEIAEGKLERVLRDIIFSGCGIVKNPANPPSLVLETANEKEKEGEEDEVVVLDMDKLDENNVTLDKVEGDTSVITKDSDKEKSNIERNDTLGICVSYKRRVYANEPAGPDTQILHEDWCSLYDQSCTSFSRDTSDPECLRNQLGRFVRTYAKTLIDKAEESDKRQELTEKLEDALEKAKKCK